jgi:Xaa-Pro aminopeptidase
MKEEGLDAYLVQHGDAHMSEYTAPKDERIAFISGFTGSQGTALITKDKSLVWTDGRYYI